MSQALRDLKLRLKQLRVQNADRRWFIPGLCLHEVLTEATIRQTLLAATIKPHLVDEVVKHVLEHAVRIFGVLVMIEQVAATVKFMEEGELIDHRLPFNRSTLDKLLPDTESAITDFEERRWEFIAPTFSRGMIHRSFPDEFVLPFMKDDKIGKGAFGTVYEIVLHPENQLLDPAFQKKLVRKELERNEDHRIELKNLAILSHLKHPNIVQLLASYTHNRKNNLIFPLADGGTLFDLFTQNQPNPFFQCKIHFLRAISGLSSAIEQLHDFAEHRIDLRLMGCHYDLRPKNILLSRGRLILADFGLSRFKELTEESATIFKKGAQDYQAPECEDIDDGDFQKHMIRRSSDIWSFGCVLAELITYMIFGSAGVAEFKALRHFTEGQGEHFLFHHGPKKPNIAVTEWLSQSSFESSESDKLLVHLIRRMLCMNAKARPKAKEVTGCLRLITLREMSEPVDQSLGEYLRENPSSFDALIERTRFDSWRYALGILEGGCTLDAANEASTWHWSDFDALLDNLKSTLDLVQSLSSLSSKEASFYRLVELNDRLDDALIGNLKDKSRTYFKISILENNDEPAFQHIHNDFDDILLPAKVRMRVALKYMNELAMRHRTKETCGRQIDETNIKIEPGYQEHITGHLLGDGVNRPILVEWRDFGRQSADKTVLNELFVRVDAIAEMLRFEKPEELCALDCRGFFLDSRRSAFGFVFDFPRTVPGNPNRVQPRSLHSILQQTVGQPELYPNLDERFWIAHKLCQSVLEWHMVGWLHKRLSSFNVLFFPTTELMADDWFRQPYVVGFSHSRPDEESSDTGGPESLKFQYYQHPSYFVNKEYRIGFDYYSLGLILLEIGIWAPLSNMVENYEHYSFQQIRQYLVEQRVPLLKQSMGRSYYEAVKSCLQGDLDGPELNGGSRPSKMLSLHLEFDEKVVKKLARIVEVF